MGKFREGGGGAYKLQNGWVSLHRKLTNHEIYSNPYLLKLWIHCLMKASYSEKEQLVGMQVILLNPGQFVTGREALAREYNAGATKQNTVSAITLWRWLLMFEDLRMLNIKKTTKYSVVTVVKWSEHQNKEQQINNAKDDLNLTENSPLFCSESEQQKSYENKDVPQINKKITDENEQQMNSKRTTDEQPMNTNNNINNLNKKDMSIQQAENFNLWWDLYSKKQGKAQCEKKFKQLLKSYDYTVIQEGTKRYLLHLQQNNVAKQYQKNPLTFLNGEHFNDEYETASTTSVSMNGQAQIFELNMED